MTIQKKKEGAALTVELDGRLDTMTSPQLETELRTSLDGITDLVLDITKLTYISSAGLRVLLSAQKVMNRQGAMTIRGASAEIMDIFDVTGFSDILNIE
ncbi:MAG: STAS domain-containing protein [Clostridia bacterium]|jgi:anti-sigma B factor antagonist|nr:STAS domain-containing protein [Clostridia bacterium]